MDTQNLLRVKDVARILVISQSSAYRLMQTAIPSIRFGRTVRVRAEDLARFIEINWSSVIPDENLYPPNPIPTHDNPISDTSWPRWGK